MAIDEHGFRVVFIDETRTLAVVIEADGINPDSETVEVITRERPEDMWGPPTRLTKEADDDD